MTSFQSDLRDIMDDIARLKDDYVLTKFQVANADLALTVLRRLQSTADNPMKSKQDDK